MHMHACVCVRACVDKLCVYIEDMPQYLTSGIPSAAISVLFSVTIKR